ncbi:MAG: hypothetical protein IT245_00185 [Bacteroidia bacterium]|nr:hypothetical protein [Bacteroidia bacterium]
MFYRSNIKEQIKFRTADNFREIANDWREILPLNHHLQCRDIEALEATLPEDIAFKYVNIYERNELIGVMYLQCLKFNSKHYHHGLLDRPGLRLLKSYILGKTADILICGNIFRVNFQGFYFKDKEKKALIFDCLNLYRQSMKPEKNFCGILVKDCSREFKSTQYTCHGFKSFSQDLTMEMEIRPNWQNFEDYLSDLSRKYRQRAIKIVSSSDKIRLIDLTVEQLTQEKERINELYMNIVNKQNIALGILKSDYFIQMKLGLGEGFKVYGYYLGDKLLAFSSHIYYTPKAEMEIHYIGLDYEYNQEFNLYFNILFDGIKQAIDKKFNKIEMGRTAREAKANAGALAVENFNYVWIRPGIVRWAMDSMGRWFENGLGDEWKKRQPFKTTPQKEAIQTKVQAPLRLLPDA